MEAAATGGLVAFASLWGTLTRLGLQGLNTYDGQSIEPLVWAQAVGCLVMGWVTYSENRRVLERWYKPLFPMVSTGYCGSVTSYSSWVFAVFQAFSNNKHYNRHGLHNVMDALTQTAATVGLSLAAFWGGRCLAGRLRLTYLDALFKKPCASASAADAHAECGASLAPHNTPAKAPSPVCAHAASIALGLFFWIGAALLCGLYRPFRRETYALVLSPPGALLRWQLARFNQAPPQNKPSVSGAIRRWPWGTAAANILAVLVYCAAETAQYVGYVTGPQSLGAYTPDACNALYGLQNGFCGTLSTISTLAAELIAMKPPRNAFAYLLFSWTIGIVISILLVGAPWWSLGMQGGCASASK
ncbi:hypothetical protein MOBT1_002324 [Malassezia obtusa]|uniref:Fluoride ion transporter CrcB n=1 Tax=Malassezia obtusa TaxID=76774 RepID=A0AAF0DZR1_9BASI|nr:hypothetical protein MOBT1_002316 [Malassezia obtusa]WFD03631.1 hypothetical protein MOBT1_002324 [Malassezia obtusa]